MKLHKKPLSIVLKYSKYHPFLVCFLFFLAYSTLSVVRHIHYGSFGFDLGITDQIVWNYARFKIPINTIYHYAFTSTFTDHIEFIYILTSPFYWIYSDPKTLLVLQALALSFSGLPVYFLAKRKKLHPLVCLTLLVSFLMFYGIQNAIWFDVHSLSFAAGILPWFAYFIETKKTKLSILFFILAISCKEDIALFTLLISFIYFLKTRQKLLLFFMVFSLLYLFAVFGIYFPQFTQEGYRFQNKEGLLSDLNPSYFLDTSEKRKVILYAFFHFGFLPLTTPLYLLPAFADLGHYFVLGHTVPTAQTFFMHYRVTLAFFFAWPTIVAISAYKKILNNKKVALYIVMTALINQYILHLPLSYLSKSWFWNKPASVNNIETVITFIPKDASVVSQNNITPHISQRKEIFTLWPETKLFSKNSPCGPQPCKWFRWAGKPQYLIVDTSSDWDIRHLLLNQEDFKETVINLEKAGFIKVEKRVGNTTLYKIVKNYDENI